MFQVRCPNKEKYSFVFIQCILHLSILIFHAETWLTSWVSQHNMNDAMIWFSLSNSLMLTMLEWSTSHNSPDHRTQHTSKCFLLIMRYSGDLNDSDWNLISTIIKYKYLLNYFGKYSYFIYSSLSSSLLATQSYWLITSSLFLKLSWTSLR